MGALWFSKNKNSNAAKLGLLAVVVVAVVVYWRWIFQLSVLTLGDWGFYFPASQKALFALPSIWDPSSMGQISVDSAASVVNMGWGLLAHALSFGLIERILYMWPIVALLALGSYWFIYNQFKSHIAAFVGAIILLLNTPYLILSTGDLTLLIGMAFAPVVFVLFQRTLDQISPRYAVITGLVASLLGFYEFRVFYILLWVLFFYFVFYVANFRPKLIMQEILRRAGVAALSLAVVLLLNAFWILGLAKLNQFVSNNVFATGLFGNNFLNTPEALTLFSPWWTGSQLARFVVQPIPFLEWLVPLLAILGLYVNRKNRTVIFFGFIAVLGLLLTKQVDAPFPSLYPWLFDHLPGFNAFREASKFYMLITISYAVLISGLIEWLWRNRSRRSWLQITSYGVIVVASAIFLMNGKPLIDGSIQALFVGRSVPTDYGVVYKLLNKQSQYFRTIWLPATSHWAFHDALHPDISTSMLSSSTWANIVNGVAAAQSKVGEIAGTAIVSQPFAKELFDMTSSKYIIVPLRDIQDQDDSFGNQDREYYINSLNSFPWLKRINIGTKQVAVYENPSYKPYISALTNIINLASLKDLAPKYNFITSALKAEFAFAPPASHEPSTSLTDLFESPGRNSLSGDTLTTKIPWAVGETAHINTNQGALSYQVVSDVISFTQRLNVGLLAGGKPLGPQADQSAIIGSAPLNAGGEFVLGQGSTLTPVDLTNPAVRDLGIPTSTPVVYSVEPGNHVNNPELENGLWRPIVEDCNDYDSSPIIGMSLVTDDLQVDKVLQLTASRHAACTGPDPISVSPGEQLMVAFDYRVYKGNEAAFQLVWGGANNAISRNYLAVTGSNWRTLRTLVTVPSGATSLRLRLEAFPNEQKPTEGIDRYTNIRISDLTTVDTLPVSVAPQYKSIAVPPDTRQLSVSDSNLSGKNLIPNPSLNNGLWQKTVGDCNNFDSNPDLGMGLDTRDHSVGRQSLELTAKRHIACTGPPAVKVQEGHVYLLSFDYQSPNSTSASYSVSFNDSDDTLINNKNIAISDQKWHTLNQTFTVPFGATQAYITFDADAADPPTTTIINRYDNFRLVEIPNVAGQYYITSGGGQTLKAPSKITYTLVNPTKKLIRITDATTPFYLAMSEAYHPQWRLELANSKSQGGLASWIPWVKPDAIPSKDHFDLDDFLNGWYVDPAALCRDHPAGCTINANGSYNLQLIAEFAPQRWFYVGLVISVTTLLACIGYLFWVWRRRWRVGIQWTSRHIGIPQAWIRAFVKRVRPAVDGIKRRRRH